MPAQTFNTIATFNGKNGGYVIPALIQGLDGNLYGVTQSTVFRVSTGGKLTTIYEFCSQPNCADGQDATGALLQTPDGTLYGTTAYGGANNGGEVFKISPNGQFDIVSIGVGPFVRAEIGFGKAGQIINILGNNLTGATSVIFNVTSAEFQVMSSTYLKAQVPTGATSGTIEVTTPTGTLASNVAFQVLP